MRDTEVLDVLAALDAAQLRVWLDGGWGVDALLGEQTRPHEDVDLVVEFVALPDVLQALEPKGFVLIEDDQPARVVLQASDGRLIDLHLVTFDTEGTGWQVGASPDGSDCAYPKAGFGEGRILDRPVPCLTPELQLDHHRGYELRDRDLQDVQRLCDRFLLEFDDHD